MADKIKVLQVLGSAGPGGAETFFMRLVSALHDGATDVDVLPVVRENSWASKQLTKLGIDHRVAPFGGFFDFKTRAILRQCIAGFKPDVVQSWMNRATKFLPKIDVPVVARLGGYYKLKYYNKNADYLVGNTQDICDYLVKNGWPADRAVYIPNFTEPPAGDFAEHKQLARDRYKVPGDAYVILLAGRLHECKGFDVILYVLRSLPEHVHALVVGSGAQKSALQAVVEADDLTERVHFVDWVNQITPIVAAADVWAVPSRIEPLGNTVLDAWAHNIPVVASRAAGPKSLIEDGVDGLLFDIDDADGAEAALRKLIDDKDLGVKLAAAGAEKLERKFSQAKVVGQYIDFYRSIMTQNNKG